MNTHLFLITLGVGLLLNSMGCATAIVVDTETEGLNLEQLEANAEAKAEKNEALTRTRNWVNQASSDVLRALSLSTGENCIMFGGDVMGRLMGPSRGAMQGNLICSPSESALVCDPGRFWKKPVRLSLKSPALDALAQLNPPQVVCHPSKLSKRIWVCGARADGDGSTVDTIVNAGHCAQF